MGPDKSVSRIKLESQSWPSRRYHGISPVPSPFFWSVSISQCGCEEVREVARRRCRPLLPPPLLLLLLGTRMSTWAVRLVSSAASADRPVLLPRGRLDVARVVRYEVIRLGCGEVRA